MLEPNNFWFTAEVDAWSRDFSYEDYLHSKDRRGDKSACLSREGYKALGALMHKEMEDYYESFKGEQG